MRVWVRYDPHTGQAEVEDEAGNEVPIELDVESDGRFQLIGPLEVQEAQDTQ